MRTDLRLAQEHDAAHHGVAYVSALRRRLIAPDLRGRVAGYLGTAPVAAPGYRTDGAWVWPERLAERARLDGVAPQEQLYEHLRRASFLLPERVPEARIAEAAEARYGPPTVDPVGPYEWIYLTDHSGETGRLLRIRSREDGSVAESTFEPTGWSPAEGRRVDRRAFVEISGPEAAELSNRLAAGAHEERLRRERESEPEHGAPRPARVFDGESPAGTPWFSPARLRIPEARRRELVAAYLAAGRPVLRVTGTTPDPMDPAGGPLPLGYRTDGRWVWPEALAHYVRSRGVAPELEFLCHIEAQGYRPPGAVPAEVVPLAAAVVKAGPPPRLFRPPPTYFWEPSGGIARLRGRLTETLRDDLRWAPTTAELPAAGYREITEADAVAFVDARWSSGALLPPLD